MSPPAEASIDHQFSACRAQSVSWVGTGHSVAKGALMVIGGSMGCLAAQQAMRKGLLHGGVCMQERCEKAMAQ